MKINISTGKSIECGDNESLLHALKANEIFLVASCGGKGTCGKCKVRVLEGDAGSLMHTKLTPEERSHGVSLACKSFPKTDITIEIPESSKLVVGDKIAMSHAADLRGLFESFGAAIKPLVSHVELHLPAPTLHDNISDLDRLRRALTDIEPGLAEIRFSHPFVAGMAHQLRAPLWKVYLGYIDEGGQREAMLLNSGTDCPRYGLAVDIGTTTVAVYLVDLCSGELVDAASTYNSQMRHGDDVITRIVHATETKDGLEELRKAVVSDINTMARIMMERKGIEPQLVESAVIAGNTTMSHIFWGFDPGYIREEPYIPTLNRFPLWRAGTARLGINIQAPVYTVPCVASYVGGDIVAGVLASRMHRSEEVALFMDIGTNGEIALGNSEWIVAAACSAGPCFEGSGIRHGMRATEGAIESVRIDPTTFEPQIKTVGGGMPVGLCGSGMIDAISEMFLTGLIDQKGSFVEGKSKRVRTSEDGPEYVLYEEGGHAITLTGVDIENILRAKAAIYAGVSLLMAEMGLTLADLGHIYIAGGFGNYLNVGRAITLGMLPDLPLEKFKFLGNTSVTGAYLSLMSEPLRREAEAIAAKMTYIELSVSRGFMDEYMSAMFLPHTDISLFPTVAKMLGR